ncbi:MAG TPA: sugar phosphate isomerase/epimerase family protein [Phycisphaerae bacterium]|nr:sugar phosphate isomerase/epimerase [Phycisphaerales bacterium]HRX85069.1 sugar phosphate isomerase/epimerase family protein [Phycisphaerae bacterium]
MAIKIGFSTSVCPDWDIHAIVEHANEMGFYGVELGTVRDEMHLPAAEDLQSDKDIDAVRKLFEDNSVELVSLVSIYAFDAKEPHIRRRSFERTVENIELAEKLGCRLVRLPLGAPVGREPVEQCLARQVPHLSELARIASRKKVTLLATNSPGFPSSRAVWFEVDGVSHPGLRAAWNPVLGMSCGEASTVAVPRLGARIRQIQAADASFNPDGRFVAYQPIGSGAINYDKTIDLLKGLLFDGYLMLDWPQVRAENIPGPQEALPAALNHLLERIKLVEPELTAYKKDKNAPNYAAAKPAFVQRQVAKAAVAEGGDDAAEAGEADAGGGDVKPRVAKGGDPKIAALVAEAVRKVRAARAARGG